MPATEKVTVLTVLLNTDTDLAAFINLYKRFGIELSVYEGEEGNYYIETDEGDSKKFDGASEIKFDEYGKFIKQTFYDL